MVVNQTNSALVRHTRVVCMLAHAVHIRLRGFGCELVLVTLHHDLVDIVASCDSDRVSILALYLLVLADHDALCALGWPSLFGKDLGCVGV